MLRNNLPIPFVLVLLLSVVHGSVAVRAWGQLRTVVVTGQEAKGVTDAQFQGFSTTWFETLGSSTRVRNFELNDRGRVAFSGILEGAGVQDNNDEGVWYEQDGELVLAVREGDQAPGEQPDIVFGHPVTTEFGPQFRFNNNGHIAILGTVRGTAIDHSNEEGIWSNRSGEWDVVLREGWEAPGTKSGVVFGTRTELVDPFSYLERALVTDATGGLAFTDQDEIAISAKLRGDGIEAANDQGVWSERNGDLQLLVRKGDSFPGEDQSNVLLQWIDAYLFNNLGNVAFQAGSEDHGAGVWVQNAGELQLVAGNGRLVGFDSDHTLIRDWEGIAIQPVWRSEFGCR